jgi:4-hydroxy-tetrahydrodipicolinate synthase
VVSVASNVLPCNFRRLSDLARGGDADAANALDGRLRASYDFLGIEPNPIPVKAILARQGIGHGLRLPLTPLSPQHAEFAASIAAEIRDLESSCRGTPAA